jgi:cobalt/nickel transport system ATP-binding protein
MDAMSDLLHFHHLSFHYTPQRPLLVDCDFRLAAGQRVALLGANGSGKSTLLHLAVGLLRPQGGTVEAFGQVCGREEDFHEVRRRAGLLFQDSDEQLFCPTVGEDVAFGPLNLRKPHAEVRRIVAETLTAVGLEGYEDRITYRLSGGEKRLVALATVLAMQPEVLLLDEPTGGLDEAATERIIRLLGQLPQAMMLVAHDRDFLREIADSAVRLDRGRVVPVELAAGDWGLGGMAHSAG